MGAVIVIGLLILLVAHAGSKAIALETQVTAANGNPTVPPDTSIAATGANPTPSPATALGAPTAASADIVMLQTNSKFALPLPSFYMVGLEQSGLQGVPLPMVPGGQFNGYNAVPSRTKQLLTNKPPATTSSGDVVYNPKL